MLDKEEINKITHVCSISNHPVSKLPMVIRERYLQGLHAVLPINNPLMSVLYKAWEKSILGQSQKISYYSGDTMNKVRAAIKLNKINGCWIRLSYPFFFDCFYLTSLCKSGMLHRQLELYSGYCNFITRKHLRDVYGYFMGYHFCDKIPVELIRHKETNEQFAAEPLKRVLVVANVSAGKSTLINALVGKKINKTATNACTKELCYIFGKLYEDGLIFKTRKNGKYKYCNSINNKYSYDDVIQIGVYFYSGLLQGERICFIDTPGFNDARNPERKRIVENALKSNDYDAVIYIANATNMGTDDERHLMETIVLNTKKPIIFVMNQLDKFKEHNNDIIDSSIIKYRQDIMKLGIKKPLIVPISAQVALLDRLDSQGLLDEEEQDALCKYRKKFENKYYDLPSYIIKEKKETHCNNLIDKTGITLLEEIINSLNINR